MNVYDSNNKNRVHVIHLIHTNIIPVFYFRIWDLIKKVNDYNLISSCIWIVIEVLRNDDIMSRIIGINIRIK